MTRTELPLAARVANRCRERLMDEPMTGFWEVTLGGFIGSSLASTLAAALLLRRNRMLEFEIKRQFDERFREFESTRLWKESCLSQLLGPAVMQLKRTKRAFNRWNSKNLYLEAKIVREGNETIRDLILSKGHLIPPELMEHAEKLVEHYDRWLEEFDTKRAREFPDNDDAFVFVGTQGFPFPSDAEEKIIDTFRKLQRELYGIQIPFTLSRGRVAPKFRSLKSIGT